MSQFHCSVNFEARKQIVSVYTHSDKLSSQVTKTSKLKSHNYYNNNNKHNIYATRLIAEHKCPTKCRDYKHFAAWLKQIKSNWSNLVLTKVRDPTIEKNSLETELRKKAHITLKFRDE